MCIRDRAFELAEDGRRGERGEGDAALGVEAVDRVEQAEVGDLEQVVEGLAGAAVAQRQPFGEGHVAAHELLAARLVAVAGEAAPELAVVLYLSVGCHSSSRRDLPASTPPWSLPTAVQRIPPAKQGSG